MANSCTHYYCCRVCDLKTTDHITYFDHLDLVHKLTYKSKQIKHLKLEPILDDPNNFCQSCEKTYSSQSNYQLHLQYVHHMIFNPIKILVDSPLSPGDVRSVFQCDVCNLGYETKAAYCKHLNSKHQIPSFGPNANPDLLPDMKHPYNYCRPCDKRFLNPNRFRNHLDYMHNIDLIRHPGLLPDRHNEKNYCRSCELNFLSTKTFHNHCMEVHNCGAHGIIKEKDHNNEPVPQQQQQQQQQIAPKTTHLGPNPNPDLAPDPLNPNNHCITCDKRYDLKKNFWAHLRKIHDVRAALGEFIIPAEQKYHCSTCDKYFLTGAAYQSHVRWIHLTIQQPTIHDPNNYCCTCNINYESQSLYHSHLRNVHKIDISSHFPETNNPVAVRDSTSPAPFKDSTVNYHQPVSIGNFRNTLPVPSSFPIFTVPPSNIHTNVNNIPPVLDSTHVTNNNSNQGSSLINKKNNIIDLTDLNDDDDEDDISVNSNTDDTFPTPSAFTNNVSLVKERTSIKFNTAAKSNMIVEYIIPENDGRPKPKEYNDPNLPDPNDTTHYCRVCKTFKKTAHQHRSHCKKVHKMVLEPYIIPFPCPDAVIDLNDPNLFCARCNKICSPKSHFKNHMKRIHGIIFRTRSGVRPSNYIFDLPPELRLSPTYATASTDNTTSTDTTTSTSIYTTTATGATTGTATTTITNKATTANDSNTISNIIQSITDVNVGSTTLSPQQTI